jgi:hypothetical protein
MYSPLPQPSQRGFRSSRKCSINWLDPDVWEQYGGSQLTSDAASYPRRMETSFPVPRKFQDTHHTSFEQFLKCVKEITDHSSVINHSTKIIYYILKFISYIQIILNLSHKNNVIYNVIHKVHYLQWTNIRNGIALINSAVLLITQILLNPTSIIK